jgi:hypothetical protein
MTDSRQRVEVPITKHLEGLVQKGVPPATRTGLFSTPKFSFLRWSASIPFDHRSQWQPDPAQQVGVTWIGSDIVERRVKF